MKEREGSIQRFKVVRQKHLHLLSRLAIHFFKRLQNKKLKIIKYHLVKNL